MQWTSADADLVAKVSKEVFSSVEKAASFASVESFGSSAHVATATPVSNMPVAAAGMLPNQRYRSPLHFVAAKLSSVSQSTSLPSLSQIPAWTSVGSSDSGASILEDEAGPQAAEDHQHWGIDAVTRFGYRLEQVLGDFPADDDTGTRCMLWSATRNSDGRPFILKSTTSSSGLSEIARQRAQKEYRHLYALRRNAIFFGEALLITRFDAWLVLNCSAGSALRGYGDDSGLSPVPAAIALFGQLLQCLAHLYGHRCPGGATTNPPGDVGGKTPRNCGNAAIDATETQAQEGLQQEASPSTFLLAGASDRDDWGPALRLYFEMWAVLPSSAQEEAVGWLVKSSVLPGLLGHDGSPQAVLNVFKQYVAVDVRVRPSAEDILCQVAL